MTLSALHAISPIDGRYFKKTRALSSYFSEYALIYYRLMVEIRWLESLADNQGIKEIPVFHEESRRYLTSLLDQFNEQTAEQVKAYETQTNHDVKAIEYYLRSQLNTHQH